MQQKKAHIVATAWLTALLAACDLVSRAGEHPLTSYLARLQRTLDVTFVSQENAVPALPRSRVLTLELDTGSIDLLDMLALRDCALETTVGKSNSSLGKLATASQRLLLELEFLAQLPGCIASLNPSDDQALIVALREAQHRKREQLPARIWNATLAAPEFRAFWQSDGKLGAYPDNTSSQVPTALARLAQLTNAWLSGDYMSGHTELEGLLDQVRRGDGGKLLYAIDRQNQGLESSQAGLRHRLSEAPLCFGNTPSTAGQILETVVRKFFIGQVQPWSVRLQRRRQDLMPPVLALEQQLEIAMPPEYAHWRQQRHALLASAVDAPKTHALLLAELLESCGLRPGINPANSS